MRAARVCVGVSMCMFGIGMAIKLSGCGFERGVEMCRLFYGDDKDWCVAESKIQETLKFIDFNEKESESVTTGGTEECPNQKKVWMCVDQNLHESSSCGVYDQKHCECGK